MNDADRASTWRIARLGEVCALRTEAVDPTEQPETPYIGLEHIDPGNPRLARRASASEVRSSKWSFYPGDVLYGKLRPYLDKGALADFQGMCSTDILVLRAQKEAAAEFVVSLL